MKKPFFSVIIPSYNHANFIEKSINSVLKQTFKSYEIIVIDNYSTDSTKNILSKYKNKIICKKIHNLGIIAKSRNLGLKISKGKWICFLDSDDEWFSDKLKIVHEQISKNQAHVICNNEIVTKGLSKYYYRLSIHSHQDMEIHHYYPLFQYLHLPKHRFYNLSSSQSFYQEGAYLDQYQSRS